MSTALSCAELGEHCAELLPARTLLSMLPGSILNRDAIDITGPRGEPGAHGENGQSMHGFNFLGWIGWGGSNPTPGPADTAPSDG